MVWAKYLNCKYKDLNFGVDSELREAPGESQEDLKEVCLVSIRDLKKVGSEGPDPDFGPHFARGDEVTVVRRTTWNIPQKG